MFSCTSNHYRQKSPKTQMVFICWVQDVPSKDSALLDLVGPLFPGFSGEEVAADARHGRALSQASGGGARGSWSSHAQYDHLGPQAPDTEAGHLEAALAGFDVFFPWWFEGPFEPFSRFASC